MKGLLHLAFFFLFYFQATAQTSFQKYFGGSVPKYISQNPDGSFIAGFDSADTFSILKLDQCGEAEFYRTFTYLDAVGLSSIEADWDGYIIGGRYRGPNSPCVFTAFVVKLDSFGDTLWTDSIACNNEWGNYGGLLLPMVDTNYIFYVYHDGYTSSNFNAFYKLDPQGQILWTYVLGGERLTSSSMVVDSFSNISFVSPNPNVLSSEVKKLDSNMNVMGEMIIYDTSGVIGFESHTICKSNDGGYLIGGIGDSIFIIKSDANLDSLWTRSYGYYNTEAVSIVQDNDSGYVLLFNDSNGDLNLFHINSMGDSIGLVIISTPTILKGKVLKHCADGGFLIIAETTDSVSGLPTSFIVKTDAFGNVNPDTTTNNAAICSDESYTLPDGTITTTEGTYYNTISGAAGCDSVILTNLIVYDTLFIQLSADSILCYGDTILIHVAATGGTPPYSGTGNFNSTAGSFFFSVTDSNGCVSSQSITVVEPLQIIANAGLGASICPGDSFVLGGNPTGSGGSGLLTYLWLPSSDLSSAIISNPTATPLLSTSYLVIVSDDNGCTTSAPVSINVGSEASPVIQQVDDTLFITTIAANYEWYLNGFLYATGTVPFIVINQLGDFVVIAYDSIGCSGISSSFTVMTLSSQPLVVDSDVVISPNPAQSFINIYLPKANVHAHLILKDSAGRSALSRMLREQNSLIQISELNEGTYIVIIQVDGKEFYSRLVVNR